MNNMEITELTQMYSDSGIYDNFIKLNTDLLNIKKYKGKCDDCNEWKVGYCVYDYKRNAYYIVTNEVVVYNAGFKPPRNAYSLEFYEVDKNTISEVE